MTPFRCHTGIVAPLMRRNVDTDAIIPSREMKKVSRDGLSEGLFAGWRYRSPESREANPDFVLNQPPYRGASILAAGSNFGCGSSREHAVWALKEYGFRVIIAESLGSIFERNCVNNGILPIALEAGAISQLLEYTDRDPQTCRITVDLERNFIEAREGTAIPFHLARVQREMLLNGWDPIDKTLQEAGRIEEFLRQDREARSWAYPDLRK